MNGNYDFKRNDKDWVEILGKLFGDWQIEVQEIYRPEMVDRLYDRHSGDDEPTAIELLTMRTQAESLIKRR